MHNHSTIYIKNPSKQSKPLTKRCWILVAMLSLLFARMSYRGWSQLRVVYRSDRKPYSTKSKLEYKRIWMILLDKYGPTPRKPLKGWKILLHTLRRSIRIWLPRIHHGKCLSTSVLDLWRAAWSDEKRKGWRTFLKLHWYPGRSFERCSVFT